MHVCGLSHLCASYGQLSKELVFCNFAACHLAWALINTCFSVAVNGFLHKGICSLHASHA